MNKTIFHIKKKTFLQLPGYFIISLWILFAAIIISWIIIASFSTTKELFTNSLLSSGWHFSNYIRAWVNNNVAIYFFNSLLYTISSGVIIIFIAAPAAYILSRYNFIGNKLIQNLFISSLAVPQIMIILPLFSLASYLRITNSRMLLIVLYVSTNVPFTVFFLQSFFSNLSTSFEEAAAIDGYSPIRTFWTIMFPLAQPGIITVSIFNFIYIWNEYFIALIFANTSEQRPLSVGLYSMIQSMRFTGDWAGMFAAVVIVFLPTFFLYIFLSEKVVSGVTGGGIKG